MVGVTGTRAKKSRVNGVDSLVSSPAPGFLKYIGEQEETNRGRLQMARIIFLTVVLLVFLPGAYPDTRRNSGVLFY